MNTKTTSIALGRPRLSHDLAGQLMDMPPRLRGQTVAIILKAHVTGLDLQKLVAAAADLRRLGVLINQSLRLFHGTSVDVVALTSAAKKVNQLWP